MERWNGIFARGEFTSGYPERAVQEFISLVERSFAERPLRLWDLCCGAGRHALAAARRGHRVYASDGSSSGVALLQARFVDERLDVDAAVADMAVCPWPEVDFHGILSWDSLHHNMVSGTREAVAAAYARLAPGGWLLATLKSTGSDSFGLGNELEPGTFAQDSGIESGVAHHYFTEHEIRDMFSAWDLRILVERRCDYRQRCEGFLDVNPFDYTAWGVLARKPGGDSRWMQS
ncbi:MAG: class I SAM-dependent methyltransferase [Armatimonadetes bacterium]|nr:class I SAM-dependent methyltransferase [Armatimonadota bacterium]